MNNYADVSSLAADDATSEDTRAPNESKFSRVFRPLFSLVRRQEDNKPTEPPKTEPEPKAVSTTGGINDRQGVFPAGMRLFSSLVSSSSTSQKLNIATVTMLQNKLQSPPASVLGPVSYAEGSRKSYVRMVESSNPLEGLPDTGRVFDDLLRARDSTSHPNGYSSLTFAFANLLTLSLVRPDPNDLAYTETSPYFDLSPLYGVNEAEQGEVRDKNGRGMLSPDCFFEDKLLFLPPALSALLVLWNRNHNYIARNLLSTKADKKWVDPSTLSGDSLLAQDDEIFGAARQINCKHFRDVIIRDFLKGLLGTATVGSCGLDLFGEIKKDEGNKVGQGEDRHSSVEFNLLYHWGATTSQSTVEWAEPMMNRLFPGTPYDQISMEDFTSVLRNIKMKAGPNRRKRSYPGLDRGPDDCFNDNDLARILQDATETTAGAYRARGTPLFMRAYEIITMEQARHWNVCSLNDFRKFLGLEAFKTFEEWNPNSEISNAARNLYGHIDKLELYSGLRAEEVMPGSGFCLGHTMTQGLLVDIVHAIRSAPHFSTEFKYGNCQENDGTFGDVLPKLLLRHLPRSYPYNNVYGLFPFTIPTVTKKQLEDMGLLDKYEFKRPIVSNVKVLKTIAAIRQVFNDPTTYPTTYENDLKLITKGHGYFLGFDNVKAHDREQMMSLYALMPDAGALARYAEYYRDTARALIEANSHPMNGTDTCSIDVVRDVINSTSARWVSQKLCGIPLRATMSEIDGNNKAEEHSRFAALYAWISRKLLHTYHKSNISGTDRYSEVEVYNMFTILHTCIFNNTEPEHGWRLRSEALGTSRIITEYIEQNILQAIADAPEGLFASTAALISELIGGAGPRTDPSHEFLARLAASGGSNEEVAANALGMAVVSSVSFAHTCSLAVNFYLDEKYSKERAEIVRLAKRDDPNDNNLIMGYIREAQRLNPQFPGLCRDVAMDDTITQGVGFDDVTVKKGDRIFADFKHAHSNPLDFPNPDTINPARVTRSIQGMGFHKCPALGFVEKTMPEVFKAVFRLDNLRRVDGKTGQLKSLSAISPLDAHTSFTSENASLPISMVLQYDRPPQKKQPAKPAPRPKPFFTIKLITDAVLIILAIAFILWKLYSSIPTRESHPVCSKLAPLRPWTVHTMLPGTDDQPVPLEYTLNHPKPHIFSIIDIDARDMRLLVYVDDKLEGETTEMVLDKSIDCGQDLNTCIEKNFSMGRVVVPKGRHTVRAVWVGEEFLPGTKEMDWNGDRQRRLLWSQDSCI